MSVGKIVHRVTIQTGGTKVRFLLMALLLVAFAAYQLLIPIDDPSLDGPDTVLAVSASSDQIESATPSRSSTGEERQVFWGDRQ